MDLTKLDLEQVVRLIKYTDVTSEELTRQCLEKGLQSAHMNAYNYVNRENALEAARKIDKKISDNNTIGILGGVPISIKDNFCTANMPVSCSSNMLRGHFVKVDATSVRKLKEQDAVIIGKCNMDEFAMGDSGTTSAFGRTKNPINSEVVPGGSSSGSAVSVATGSCFASLGTDTGGSVRQPAAFCGLTGLKPTFGRVSCHGVFPLAPSLDHVGIITKTVKDCLLVLETVYGPDALDPSSNRQENTNLDAHCLEYDDKRMKIAVLKQSFSSIVDPDIRDATKRAVDFFTNAGYLVEEIDFRFHRFMSTVYSILCCAQVVAQFDKFDGRLMGRNISRSETFDNSVEATRGEFFGIEAKQRLLFGRYVRLPENYDKYYDKARRIRTLIINYFREIFTKYNIVLSPTTACLPFLLDGDRYNEQIEYCDTFLAIANLTGRPAVSVPAGKSKSGLPIGIQFMGKTFAEADVLNVANTFEKNIGKSFITRM